MGGGGGGGNNFSLSKQEEQEIHKLLSINILSNPVHTMNN